MTSKICVGCSKIDDYDSPKWEEICTGAGSSFYLCDQCFIKKKDEIARLTKDLNTSEVIN